VWAALLASASPGESDGPTRVSAQAVLLNMYLHMCACSVYMYLCAYGCRPYGVCAARHSSRSWCCEALWGTSSARPRLYTASTPPLHRLCTASTPPLHRLCTASAATAEALPRPYSAGPHGRRAGRCGQKRRWRSSACGVRGPGYGVRAVEDFIAFEAEEVRVTR
jgi:hypothetical protein